MHRNVFVGGTFDRLHAGHESLLSEAFAVGEKVTIGLTSDAFVRTYKFQISNFKFQIRRYEDRKKIVEKWLTANHVSAVIIPIHDPYEPAATLTNIDALIVTLENKARGEEINRIRKKRGLELLAIIEVPIVPAEDGQPISSTRIRNGDVDCAGNLMMPESLRHILAQPLGKVLTGEQIKESILHHANDRIISVGDVTTKTVLDLGTKTMLGIIDQKVGRMPYNFFSLVPKSVVLSRRYVRSGPGSISEEARLAIQGALVAKEKHHALPVIVVDGEEDLLVLPVIVYAVVGTIVYYGQPGEGVVEVVVTEGKKRQATELLGQFTNNPIRPITQSMKKIVQWNK